MSLMRDYSKYSGVPGGLWRHQTDRLGDRVNAKDYMIGDGTNTVAELQKFSEKLVNFHYAGIPPVIVYDPSTILGDLPGGKYRGDGTPASDIKLLSYGSSLRGDGVVSDIINASVIVGGNETHVENLRIVGDGDLIDIGIGLDIQAGAGRFFDVNVFHKGIGISTIQAASPGGTASNLTLFGGWVRECKTGVQCATADYRAFGQRVGGDDVAFHWFDSGGISLNGCHFSATAGPSFLIEGRRIDFLADGEIGSAVLTNVNVTGGDYNTIKPGDIIGTFGIEARFLMQANSRVVSKTSTTITLDRPLIGDCTQNYFAVNEVPIESFINCVTAGSGSGNALTYDVESIADAPGLGSLVTLKQEHKFSIGMSRIRFQNTGIPLFDDPLNRGWGISVPSAKQIIVSHPFSTNITTTNVAKLLANADSVQMITHGPSSAQIQALFCIGGNFNGTELKGGVAINLVGTRTKGRVYMHGVRPFTADTNTTKDILENVAIPTSEFRLGTALQLGTVLQAYTLVTGIPGNDPTYNPAADPPMSVLVANSIRISKKPLLTTAQSLIISPDQPNHIIHFATYDVQGAGAGDNVGNGNLYRRFKDIGFSGPGSLIGCSQIGGIATIGQEAWAIEGDEEVGVFVPYTRGGLLDNKPAVVNKNVMMNNGWRLATNGVQYDVQGNNWYIDTPLVSLRSATVDPYGTTITDDTEFASFSNTGAFLTLPTVDPHIVGHLWVDTAAGRVVKSSAG